MTYHQDLAVRMSRAISRICAGEADGGRRLATSLAACAAIIDGPRQASIVDRAERLTSAGARFDAALALLDLAPAWRLRRLVFDDGCWHCSLSRHSVMPDWLDQTVDAQAGDSAVAVVTALADLVVGRRTEDVGETPAVGEFGAARVVCDHFA